MSEARKACYCGLGECHRQCNLRDGFYCVIAEEARTQAFQDRVAQQRTDFEAGWLACEAWTDENLITDEVEALDARKHARRSTTAAYLLTSEPSS